MENKINQLIFYLFYLFYMFLLNISSIKDEFFHFVYFLWFDLFPFVLINLHFGILIPFSMFVCFSTAVFFAFYVIGGVAQNFETGDNSTVRGCSNHCSYGDRDLACWNRSLVFFEKILFGQMRNYVAVQMNIDQWRRRNVRPYKEEFEEAKRHSINTMIAQTHFGDDVVNNRTIETVVNALVDFAALQSNHSLLKWMPHFQCPIPCEHRYTVWRNLFILSSVLNVCLFIAILPLVKRMHNNDLSESLIQRG